MDEYIYSCQLSRNQYVKNYFQRLILTISRFSPLKIILVQTKTMNVRVYLSATVMKGLTFIKKFSIFGGMHYTILFMKTGFQLN